MPKRFLIISFSLVLIALLGISCDDRGTGIPNGVDLGIYGDNPSAQHSFDTLLTLQLANSNEVWLASSFIPTSALNPPLGSGTPTPVLILLPPQDGDRFYFQRAGLVTLAQELIVSGEIEPMIIHCPANATAFGGMFYGNSAPAGFNDTILSAGWIEDIEFKVPSAITSLKSKRGIGGIGMGAYGAFRAAIVSTDTTTGLSNFGSVSGSTGPLDFDASGNAGLIPLFPQAIAEQLTLDRYVTGGETFNLRKFDSGDVFISLPLSRLFIGGAVAFSPHDTGLNFNNPGVLSYNTNQPFGDSLRVIIDIPSLAVESTVVILDSTTFVDSLTQLYTDFGYHLPFDENGTVYSPIWELWMRNNLDSLYIATGSDKLDSTDIFIGNNPGAKWNYTDMTDAWISFLQGQVGAANVEVFNYSGPGGTTYTGTENVYDVLREMLIFHSKSFEN